MKKTISLICCISVFAVFCLCYTTSIDSYGKNNSNASLNDPHLYSDDTASSDTPTDPADPSVTPDPSVSPEPTITPEPTSTPDPNALTEAEKKKIKKFKSSKVKSVKVKKALEKKVKLTWKKYSGAKKYIVLRSTKKSTGYKTLTKTKKTYYTDKKAKKRKQYYYRVKATTTIKSKTYYSKQSTAKKIYVFPKTPRAVIVGECFVEGMKELTRIPKNITLVAKIGINTTSMLTSNYFSYNGQNLTAIERVAYCKPDRVYFLVGANESAWQNVNVTMSNFAKMRSLLMRINKHVQLVMMKIGPFGTQSPEDIPTPAERNKFNSAYKSFANKYSNTYFCPATDVLQDGSGHLMGKYSDGDGCHWNTNGTIAVVERMKSWSKKKFGNW